MNITQLRNATVLLEMGPFRILVDPMLSRAGALPSLKWFTRSRRRNPLVELPRGAAEVLASATHALITHCRKGHFDHLDRQGMRWLRERQLPVLCMPEDGAYLRQRGLNVVVLEAEGSSRIDSLTITPVPCLHGEGWVLGRLMAHGHGYLLQHPDEASVYIAGDTVLTPEVRRCVTQSCPAVEHRAGGWRCLRSGGRVDHGRNAGAGTGRGGAGLLRGQSPRGTGSLSNRTHGLAPACHGSRALVPLPGAGRRRDPPFRQGRTPGGVTRRRGGRFRDRPVPRV